MNNPLPRRLDEAEPITFVAADALVFNGSPTGLDIASRLLLSLLRPLSGDAPSREW